MFFHLAWYSIEITEIIQLIWLEAEVDVSYK